MYNTNIKRDGLTEAAEKHAQSQSTQYQGIITTLGKHLLSIEIDQMGTTPLPVLKLLLGAEWLIPEHGGYIVEAEVFSDDETLFFIGINPEYPMKGLINLDSLVAYAKDIIVYNDAIEAKKIELDLLLQEKTRMLEESIRLHREKVEKGGTKFKVVTPRRPIPPPAPKVEVEFSALADKLRQAFPEERQFIPEEDVKTVMYEPPIKPVPRVIPEGIDPSIFDPDFDRDAHEGDLMPEIHPARPTRVAAPADGEDGGLRLVAPPLHFDRDTPIRQRHENY